MRSENIITGRAVGEQRDIYLAEGLSYVPKLLELVDKNRLSRTYGCFDRAYWHYRTIDFPSGMYQESVLPLALAYNLDVPGNPYHGAERIKELVIAGIEFAERSAHAEGSCDDYFPYERAAGATAFALYATTEAYLVLGLKDEGMEAFFKRRGGYLAKAGYEESGVLSNHRALILLSLYNVFLTTGDSKFRDDIEGLLPLMLKLQTEEGWFPEYEGCDPGYLTFTIDFLAKYFSKSRDERIPGPLTKAIEFASYYMHPDGSFGGEYGSRNTFHFLPHGFELMNQYAPRGAAMCDAFLKTITQRTRSYIDDDRIFIHYTYNYLQAYEDFSERHQVPGLRWEESFEKFFERAGLLVRSAPPHYAVISTKKGGVVKIFREGKLAYSDAGLVGRTRKGKKFISQVAEDHRIQRSDGSLSIEGYCYEHEDTLFSPWSYALFHFLLVAFFRFLPPNQLRAMLQRKAITKRRKKLPIRYRKEFDLKDLKSVSLTIWIEDDRTEIKELWIGTDPTFIYVATSQPFQQGNLKPWINLASSLPELHERKTMVYRCDLQ